MVDYTNRSSSTETTLSFWNKLYLVMVCNSFLCIAIFYLLIFCFFLLYSWRIIGLYFSLFCMDFVWFWYQYYQLHKIKWKKSPSSIFLKRLYRIGINFALILGIYQKKTIIQKDPCTSMFIAALFPIAKTWKQPQCPSREERINKM